MKILFGVFDWGLGHATRDTPLIKELLKRNDIHIISTGRALKVLKDNFKGQCRFYDVPSLHHVYSKTRTNIFQIDFALSLPKIMKSLQKAKKISQKIVKRGFDKVISDCRYDVYDTPENSYLINHQLRFKTTFGFERLAERWLASQMKRYKFIIVPDFNKKNISGRLSHGLRYINKGKIRYIGILSHIRKIKTKKDIDYFFSLSGPELTRIKLEEAILTQIGRLKGKMVIAGGNPDVESKKINENVEFYSYLNSKMQESFMNRARCIVIRAGYTTIMELAELGRGALLIPSPGQTEQEYLGDYLEGKRYFHHINQYKLKLERDVKDSMSYKGFKAPWKTEESVKKFIEVIKS